MKFQVGDIVSRDGTDLHRITEVTDCGDAISVVCIRAPRDGWCKVGHEEFNMSNAYHYPRELTIDSVAELCNITDIRNTPET